MKDKTTIFDFLNSINNKKKIDYNKKDLSSYMLSLWLSHSIDCIDIVNKMNEHLFDIKKELVYDYYFDKIPKKRRFIKYIKGKKSKNKNDLNLSSHELQYYKNFI